MRHFHVRTVAIAAVAILALTACGSSSKSSTAADAASSPTTTGGAYSPPASATPTTAAAATAATVALASVNNKDVKGKVLVDANGRTLYVWDKDTTPGKASCTGACAAAWPPLYVTGTPTYGTGLTGTMFSTVTGPNGNKQLAINGKPLYMWAADTKAGDATGQGVNGFYVVTADGKKVDSD